MKICPKCGEACPDEMVFCSECGEKLDAEEIVNEEIVNEEPINEEIVNEVPASEGCYEDVKPLGFGEAFKVFFKKMFNFKGRASRREFWFCFAWYSILMIPVIIVESVVFSVVGVILGLTTIGLLLLPVVMVVGCVSGALFSAPILGVMWRRIQDTDKPGALALIMFGSYIILLPCIIVPLIFCFFEGTDGPNKYGEKPVR